MENNNFVLEKEKKYIDILKYEIYLLNLKLKETKNKLKQIKEKNKIILKEEKKDGI